MKTEKYHYKNSQLAFGDSEELSRIFQLNQGVGYGEGDTKTGLVSGLYLH